MLTRVIYVVVLIKHSAQEVTLPVSQVMLLLKWEIYDLKKILVWVTMGLPLLVAKVVLPRISSLDLRQSKIKTL
jgi:hypothetical protein